MILFSIVVPYYNSSNSLDRLFITLTDYFNHNCEIIIVDDCSEAEEFDKLNKKIQESGASNIFLKSCVINKGAAFARQFGVDLASGEYIAFLDSDDGWSSNRVFLLIDFMEKNNLDIIGGATIVVNNTEFNDVRYIDINTKGDFIDFKSFIFKNFYSTPSVIVKRKIFQTHKFNIGMRYSEDWECWRRIVYSSNSYLLENSACYSFKHCYISTNTNSLSASTRKMSKGELYGLYVLFKNKNIGLKYKFLLPTAIFYSFFKALCRELRRMISFK